MQKITRLSWRLACAVTMLAACSSRSDGQPTFDLPLYFGAGDPLFSIATGDYDEDGFVDYAVARFDTDEVCIVLNNGDGIPGGGAVPCGSYSVGDGPYAVVADDFNADGHVDLAVVNNIGNSVTILRGNGTGEFNRTADLATGAGPQAIATADLNGDGASDLVVANNVSDSVSIFTGNGAGAFAPNGTRAVGDGPVALAVGDFDADGNVDIVTADNVGDTITLVAGDGLGGFQAPSTLSCGDGPIALVAQDLNDDLREDLAVANNVSGDVWLFLSDGLGGFSAPTSFNAGSAPSSVAVVDSDLDGHRDLVASSWSTGRLRLLRGDGTGNFNPTQDYWIGGRPIALATADLNNDGLVDIAASNWASVCVLFGRSTGGYDIVLAFGVGTSTSITPAAVGDFDDDGFMDVVSAVGLSERFTIRLGIGTGALGPGSEIGGLASAIGACVGDFDENDRLDLAMTDYYERRVAVFLGDGTGGFEVPRYFAVSDAPVAFVKSADLNEDGHLDLAVSGLASGFVGILLGNGAGGFVETDCAGGGGVPACYGSFGEPYNFAIADLDGDGHLDLAVPDGSNGANRVGIVLGDGSGSFGLPTFFNTGATRAFSVAASDFDEDGVVDLAVACNGAYKQHDGAVSILFGNGDGSFASGVAMSAGDGPYSLLAHDLDGDEHADIAVANNFGNDLSIITGRGDGTFDAALQVGAGVGPQQIFAEDVDGDGRQDLLTTNGLSDNIAVTMQLSSGAALGISIRCSLSGNVNSGLGNTKDVLLVNGMVGHGPERKLVVDRTAPFRIEMLRAPSKPSGVSRFILYLWTGESTAATARTLPFGIGESCMTTPLSAGMLRPRHVWNNLGHESSLGFSTRPSSPAPSTLVDMAGGTRKRLVAFMQGLIVDPGAVSSRGVSVTNGILIDSR